MYEFDSYWQGRKVSVTIDGEGKIIKARRYDESFNISNSDYPLMESIFAKRIQAILDEIEQEAKEYNEHVNHISATWRNQ